MNKFVIFFILLFFNSIISHAGFKEIKKKAIVNNPEIIFPIPKNLEKCITKMYIDPKMNLVKPVLKVEAPVGYGLDDRFDNALDKFSNFSRPCSGGNREACENVKRIIVVSSLYRNYNWKKIVYQKIKN